MRPLPDLSPIVETQPVFQLPQDDWVSFFAQNDAGLDDFLASLESQENTQAANAAAIGQSIDGLDSSLGDLLNSFGILSDVMDALTIESDADEAIGYLSSFGDLLTAGVVYDFTGLFDFVNQLIGVMEALDTSMEGSIVADVLALLTNTGVSGGGV